MVGILEEKHHYHEVEEVVRSVDRERHVHYIHVHTIVRRPSRSPCCGSASSELSIDDARVGGTQPVQRPKRIVTRTYITVETEVLDDEADSEQAGHAQPRANRGAVAQM